MMAPTTMYMMVRSTGRRKAAATKTQKHTAMGRRSASGSLACGVMHVSTNQGGPRAVPSDTAVLGFPVITLAA